VVPKESSEQKQKQQQQQQRSASKNDSSNRNKFGKKQRWWRKRWRCDDPNKASFEAEATKWTASSEAEATNWTGERTDAEDTIMQVMTDEEASSTSSKNFEISCSSDGDKSSRMPLLFSGHEVVRTADIQSLLPSMDVERHPSGQAPPPPPPPEGTSVVALQCRHTPCPEETSSTRESNTPEVHRDADELLIMIETTSNGYSETGHDIHNTNNKSNKKRRQKREKGHMVNESEVLGMIVQFDPTFQLLEVGDEPECVERSTLKKLQKSEVYVDSLLGGGRSGEEEDGASGASAEEALLGFHLDDTTFTPPPRAYHTTTSRDTMCPSFDDAAGNLAAALHQDSKSRSEEIEIVFYYDDDDRSEDSESEEDGNYNEESEALEITFFACHEEAQEEAEEEENRSESASSRYLDCRSEHTTLPSEWFLPQGDALRGQQSSMESSHKCTTPVMTPPYEWFYPDHRDIEPVKKNMFSATRSCCNATPCTVSRTWLDFSSASKNDTTTDSSSESDSVDVFSVGSGTSQAVQNLIEFVGI
jgi:hypothetical protein